MHPVCALSMKHRLLDLLHLTPILVFLPNIFLKSSASLMLIFVAFSLIYLDFLNLFPPNIFLKSSGSLMLMFFTFFDISWLSEPFYKRFLFLSQCRPPEQGEVGRAERSSAPPHPAPPPPIFLLVYPFFLRALEMLFLKEVTKNVHKN